MNTKIFNSTVVRYSSSDLETETLPVQARKLYSVNFFRLGQKKIINDKINFKNAFYSLGFFHDLQIFYRKKT